MRTDDFSTHPVLSVVTLMLMFVIRIVKFMLDVYVSVIHIMLWHLIWFKCFNLKKSWPLFSDFIEHRWSPEGHICVGKVQRLWLRCVSNLVRVLIVCFCLQGALYCLLGAHSSVCLASWRDWDCIGEVWPALVRCGLSPTMSLEKPSIGGLLDDIIDRIHRQHDTIGIVFTVSNVFISCPCVALC